MLANIISSPFPQFTEINGQPLENGYIYIGEANQNPEVVPLPVYWDSSLTTPAAQPIRTINGYPSRSGTIAAIYSEDIGHSITVRNDNEELVYSATSEKHFVFLDITMFGAVGDGATDNTAAFASADAYGIEIYVPKGTYKVTSFPTGRYYADDAYITDGATTYKVSSLPNKLALLSDIITIGTNALGNNIGGTSSVVIGNNAGAAIEYSNANVLIGDSAGASMLRGVSLPFESVHNVMIGRYAGRNNTTGYYNTFVGAGSGDANTIGKANTFIGQNAGRLTTSGHDNTFLGEGACANADPGNSNTALGVNSAIYASGTTFTAVGSAALFMKFPGDNNTAIGSSAIYGANDGGEDGGYNPLRTYLANNNTAVGKESMFFTDNGTNNSSVGRRSLYVVEDGDFNCALGAESGFAYTGNSGTFIGYRAGYSLSTGSIATMIGHNAGYYANGNNNTLVGYSAGRGASALSDYSNSTALGHDAGYSFRTANSSCTAIGRRALYSTNAGLYNTGLGENAGSSNVSYSNITAVGYNAQVTGSNQVQLGNSSTTTYAYGAVQDRSDMRDKADIANISDATIAFFMEIEWKSFVMDYREDYLIRDEETGEVIGELPKDGSKKGKRTNIGAIAQQIEAAMLKHNINFAGLQHHAVNGGNDVYSIGYQHFIGIQGEIIQRQQKDIIAIKKHLGLS